MLKIKALIFFCFISIICYSQEEPNFLPNVTNPSPNAYAITKYGDLPMNEFNGTISHSLPLMVFKSANIEVPINLNYSGTGVKVDDAPTWVGMNFTLDAGGIITRTLKDIPDELAENRVLLSDAQIEDYKLNTFDGSTNASFLRALVENDQIDSEVDIFNFSFAGYSGSFYLDSDLKPVLLKSDKPLKISIDENFDTNKIIIITTPEGFSYFFGGEGAYEETTTRAINSGVFSSFQDSNQGVTAYYLKSISDPTLGSVYFEYTTHLGMQITPIKDVHKRRKIIQMDPVIQTCDGINPICTNMLSNINDTDSHMTISSRVLNPKYLTRIYNDTNTKEIVFNSRPVDNRFFKRVLDKIVYRRVSDSLIIKTVDFNYIGFQQNPNGFGGHGGTVYSDISKRFFLEKVLFDKDKVDAPNTANGRRNEVYEFEYESPLSLPPIFSLQQDFYGFFNGESGNIYAFPDNILINPYNYPGYSNRYPNFNFSIFGALKRIYYPTGGYTEFEYEPTKVKKKKYNVIYLNTRRFIENMPDQPFDGVPRLDSEGVLTEINNLPQNQEIDINVILTATASDMAIIPQNEKVTFRIYEVLSPTSKNLMVDRLLAMPYDNSGQTVSHNHIETFIFEAGKRYEVNISIDNVTSTSQNPFNVDASISLFDGFEQADGFGVLLKKQTDYAEDGLQGQIKRYYYSSITNTSPSIEDLPLQLEFIPVETEKSLYNYNCSDNEACEGGAGGSYVEYFYFYNYLLSSSIALNDQIGIPRYEKVSISYGGDNFEMGGVEKTFEVNGSDNGALEIPTQIAPGTLYTNVFFKDFFNINDFDVVIPSAINGNLLKEKYYINDGGVLKKSREKTYLYDNVEITRINNVFGSKIFDIFYYHIGTNINNSASNYFLGHYKVSSRKNELLSVVTKEYIEPVPTIVENETSYKKIITTQQYEYSNYRGLPTKISTSDSFGEVNEVRNFYANQLSSFTDLNGNQISSFNKLVSLNRISQPIYVENYKNNQLLSKQRTLYKQWGSNLANVQPEIVQTAKGSGNLENRVAFLSYDPRGNPTMFSKINGSKTMLNYNSNGQIYLKIENYTPPSGSSSGGEFINTEIIEETPCDLYSQYPNSFVTIYNYDFTTNLLTSMIDPNCKKTKYEYNTLHQLIRIRDNDNKIVKEFDNNFKRY